MLNYNESPQHLSFCRLFSKNCNFPTIPFLSIKIKQISDISLASFREREREINNLKTQVRKTEKEYF